MIQVKDTHSVERLEQWQLFCEPTTDNMLDYSLEHFIAALSMVGDVTVTTVSQGIPLLYAFETTKCYLNWDIRLNTTSSREQIETICQAYDVWFNISFTCLTTIEDTVGQGVNQFYPMREVGKLSQLEMMRDDDALLEQLREASQHYHFCRQYAADGTPQATGLLCLHWKKLGLHLEQIKKTLLQQQLWSLSQLASQLSEMVNYYLPSELKQGVIFEVKGDYNALDRQTINKLWPCLVGIVTNFVITIANRLLVSGPKSAKSNYLILYCEQTVQHIHLTFIEYCGFSELSLADVKKIQVQGEKDEKPQRELAILTALLCPVSPLDEVLTEIAMRDCIQKHDIKLTIKDEKYHLLDIALPFTQAEIRGRLIRERGKHYILPESNTQRMVKVSARDIVSTAEQPDLYFCDEHYIKVITLATLLGEDDPSSMLQIKALLILSIAKQQIAVGLSTLPEAIATYHIRALQPHHHAITGVRGAYIDPLVSLQFILDLSALADVYLSKEKPETN